MRLRMISAVFVAAVLVFAGGCSFSELSLEDSLRPPKIMGDEAEIEQLISDSADGGYTLKYPKSGSFRSAIIMYDLDGDEIDEAIAFFRCKDEITSVHMLVMNEDNGEWKISGDFITETTDVDCVDFADLGESDSLEILVGYTTYTPNVNFLSCYAYQNGSTETISAGQSYSAFYCGDLDGSGKSEVIALSLYNVDAEAKATMLEYSESKKALYARTSVAMDPNIVKYKNAVFTDFPDGTRGLAVDGSSASEEINTQIIYFSNELAVLRNPLYKDKIKNVTQRDCEVLSADIDNDMAVEIPVIEKLPYAGADAAQNVADKIMWYHFVPDSESMEFQSGMAANYSFHYALKIPEAWANETYTAMNDDDGKTTVFSEWTKNGLGSELFEIKVFEVSQWDLGKNTDEYTLIYRDSRYAYTFLNYESDSPLALTDDEIKTAFSVLNGTTD